MAEHLVIDDTGLLPEKYRNSVLAIGNFDGVHLGHQAVLSAALQQAKKRQCPAIVMTFEPHPRSVFQKEEGFFRLTYAAQKREIFQKMGFDAVIEQKFNKSFYQEEAAQFIKKRLVQDLKMQHIVVGYDFHFGAQRLGTPEFLQRQAREFSFTVELVPPYRDKKGEIISSTCIRHFLAQAKVEEAAQWLGYRFQIVETICHGKKLGRKLGFATANMHLPSETALSYGIYAVRFHCADGRLLDGVASFGCRPTLGEKNAPVLETHLFNFDKEIYGEKAIVHFFSYLRPELKFAGLDPLIIQMREDAQQAKQLLSQVKPISELDKKLSFEERSVTRAQPN